MTVEVKVTTPLDRQARVVVTENDNGYDEVVDFNETRTYAIHGDKRIAVEELPLPPEGSDKGRAV